MSGPYEDQAQRGEIVGQTAVQAARRDKVMELWLNGASYKQIVQAFKASGTSISTWTVMHDLKFCKDELRERFAATLEQRRDQIRLELDFIKVNIYSMLDGESGAISELDAAGNPIPIPPLSMSDRIKLYQTFMQATKLEATIDGLTAGATVTPDDTGKMRPILFMVKANLPGADVQVTEIEGKMRELPPADAHTPPLSELPTPDTEQTPPSV